MSWATPAETLTWTGTTVSQAELEASQGIIEMLAGTTELASDAGNISSTNLRHLKKANAYQAAWMQEHPDVFTAMDISQMAEGGGSGMSITLANNGVFLAPMARMSLSQLSWKAVRSIRVRPRNEAARRRIEAQYSLDGFETGDDCGSGEWRAL
ncbi:hypothetical protein QFZ22_003775 [Streptomyces canus]|uniref:Uncharacterized protein n=1 Tax=Streptomyces canus TaxID=58343 RepID=A0AAW8FF48_9ACTN|nr:hypothetical protein [Streptomyces canus]